MTNYVGEIPQGTLRTASLGIEGQVESVAEKICTVRTDVEVMEGTAPLFSTEMTVRNDKNRNMASGAEADPEGVSAGSVSYNCLRQEGFFFLEDKAVMSAGGFNVDLLSQSSKQARAQANLNVDLQLQDVIQDTSVNETFDATTDGDGAWTDYTTPSSPYEQLNEIIDSVPGCDTIVFGRLVIQALLHHPDTYARESNFDAGMATQGELVALLKKAFPQLEHVWPIKKFYRLSKAGETLSIGWLYDDDVWVGHKADLQLFDPQNPLNNYAYSERVERKAGNDVGHRRWTDIKRPHKEMGLYVQNAA